MGGQKGLGLKYYVYTYPSLQFPLSVSTNQTRIHLCFGTRGGKLAKQRCMTEYVAQSSVVLRSDESKRNGTLNQYLSPGGERGARRGARLSFRAQAPGNLLRKRG
jgi:hypothetical protein